MHSAYDTIGIAIEHYHILENLQQKQKFFLSKIEVIRTCLKVSRHRGV